MEIENLKTGREKRRRQRRWRKRKKNKGGSREEWELRKMEVEERVGVKEDGGREKSGS